jgi:hypothetical protein
MSWCNRNRRGKKSARKNGVKGKGMQDLTDVELRLAAALDRIDAGIKTLPESLPQAGSAKGDADLQMALDEERMLSAQLNERLRAVKEKDTQSQSQVAGQLSEMSNQLDAQGAELKRMRNTNMQLNEILRILREAAAQGLADPHLVNRAMLAELDALRATRLTEVAQMDEILAELAPLIEEVREDA